MENMIYILDIVRESISNGIGYRAVIFCAGCNFKCYNCHNSKTWNMNNGYLVPIKEVYDHSGIKTNPIVSGVTFSGGEPMLQATAFIELAKMIKKSTNKNIWCYTGYRFEDLISRQDDKFKLLKMIDVLVDGQYMDDLRDLNLAFRGSKNQRIIDVQKSLQQKSVIELNYD